MIQTMLDENQTQNTKKSKQEIWNGNVIYSITGVDDLWQLNFFWTVIEAS